MKFKETQREGKKYSQLIISVGIWDLIILIQWSIDIISWGYLKFNIESFKNQSIKWKSLEWNLLNFSSRATWNVILRYFQIWIWKFITVTTELKVDSLNWERMWGNRKRIIILNLRFSFFFFVWLIVNKIKYIKIRILSNSQYFIGQLKGRSRLENIGKTVVRFIKFFVHSIFSAI